jgi:hypothetical protein
MHNLLSLMIRNLDGKVNVIFTITFVFVFDAIFLWKLCSIFARRFVCCNNLMLTCLLCSSSVVAN